MNNEKKETVNIKKIVPQNHMTLGKIMDLMNRDYDQNDPRFLREVTLHIYDFAKRRGRIEISEQIKNNMVTNPETIGLPKDNDYLQGMEQAIETIDKVYDTNVEQKKESRTK